jgi:hypothetical protein
MKKFKLTRKQEQCLHDQAITADKPGRVLRDFGMLLDFLGMQGVEAAGKYNLLPLKLIGELDSRLSHPLRLELKRPQLRSHPYLQALHLLLRASGLSRVEGAGVKARLVLDPEMLVQWHHLNPTEQYFNLLEAWLRFGRSEMVGESDRTLSDMLSPIVTTLQYLPEEGQRLDPENPHQSYIFGVGRDLYLLALLDLFGLVAVEQPPPPFASWGPAKIEHVPFGDAVITVIASRFYPHGFPEIPPDEDRGQGVPAVPRFGAWQPLFQPYFPEWRDNLELPEPEPRDGTFIFRVSLGKVWRLIAMPAGATLDDLVDWILRSVRFDHDHLYEFTYRDRLGVSASVSHPWMDEGPSADEIAIGALPLEPGQTMELLYDFGDEWPFTIKLERIEPPGAKIKAPRILESRGRSPKQYENDEW